MKRSTADAINVLGQFCGMRDVERLDSAALLAKYSIPQADVFVLFGGSILAGGDLLAQAMKDRIAKAYVIVGGAGHTTEALRQKVHGVLEMLKENNIKCSSIILCQDATMQRRMDAGLRKYTSGDLLIINYASYRASVIVKDDDLVYSEPIHGMWNMDRYVNLLMGEIPRLKDDESGYGPKGKNFIAHVDIPETVYDAFKQLKAVYGDITREANPEYASK